MFNEKIKAAYQEQRLRDEANLEEVRLRDEAKIKEELFGLFGTKEGFVIEDRLVKFSDGLILRAEFEYGYLKFAVYGHCPECGCEAWSSGASSLEGLGRKLVEFKPDFQHRCHSSEEPVLTSEDRLIFAIRDMVTDIIEES